MSGVRRPRHGNVLRSGGGGAGRTSVARRWCDRAVDRVAEPILRPDAAKPGKALQGHYENPLAGSDATRARRDPERHRRRTRRVHLQGRRARVHRDQAVRGRAAQSATPLPGDRQRLGARGTHPLPGGKALRGLQRRPFETRGFGGARRRQQHRRGLRFVDPSRAGLVRRRDADPDAATCRDRPPHPARDSRPLAVPGRCRAGLPHLGARVGDVVGRRVATHPPGQPDRLRPDRRAVRAGRAVDRPAPARQRTSADHAAAAARPGQHRSGRGTRRGCDPRRRPRDRHGPGRRGERRPRHRRRHAGGDLRQSEVADRRLPVRPPPHRGAAAAPPHAGGSRGAGRRCARQ